MQSNQNNQLGMSSSLLKTIHYTILIAMLHSTFIAPAQILLHNYLNTVQHAIAGNASAKSDEVKRLNNGKSQIGTTARETASAAKYVKYDDKVTRNSVPAEISIAADIREGVIGLSKENPIDNPADNLFKIFLNELPPIGDKVYLSYDLFGISDNTGVAKSINERLSHGGYIIKNQNAWTAQSEEIDASWLKEGENIVLFTVPKNATHHYKIRNLKLTVQKNDPGLESILVLPTNTLTLTKNNELYIKGFLRGNHNQAKVEAGNTVLEVNNNEFEGFIKITDLVKQTRFLLLKAFDNNGILGQELISLDNLIEADKVYPLEDKHEIVQQKYFDACAGGYVKIAEAKLNIAENAVEFAGKVSVSHLRNIDLAPLGSGMVNVTGHGRGYRVSNEAGNFSQSVKLQLGYDTTLLPTGYSVNDIRTFYFDTHSKKWIEVEKDNLNTELSTLTSNITRQGDYINGIIQAPESPETAAFVPTMMNDIKAADPSSDLTIVSPPGASQKGSANISYPINIPAGRKGLQPQLALQYSNDGGSSWVGQGWNLSIPAITIDTRWGTPVFDDVSAPGFPVGKETESYLLAGEQLMYPDSYMPNRHQEAGFNTITTEKQPRNSSGSKLFYPRKQGSFVVIERLGSSPSTYYWKVISTDGTISWYGGSSPQEVQANSAVIRGANNKIIHWALSKVEDVYGNNIIYYYDQGTVNNSQATGQNSNLQGGKYFYPMEIWYTGFEGTQGNYMIEFERSSNIRIDATITARLGVKQVDPYLLNRINVRYIPENIILRNYQIGYGLGRFGKLRPVSIGEQGSDPSIKPYVHTFEYYDDVQQGENAIYFNSGTEVTVCNDEYQPCPDSDGDGICDENDLCPTESGSPANDGCPDNGGAGIYDCFEVSFPIPMENIIWKYNYSINYLQIESECKFSPVRVKEIQFGTSQTPLTTFTPTSDIYLTHFQNGALTNLCSVLDGTINNGAIFGTWYSTGIRNANFAMQMLPWLTQSVITDPGITNVHAMNLSDISELIIAPQAFTTQNRFSVSFVSPDPNVEMEAALEYLDMDNGGTAYLAEDYGPFTYSSSLAKSILSGDGINVGVQVNGTNLGTQSQYNFGQGLETFMYAFREQYGFQAQITVSGNQVRIVVPNSGSILHNIRIGNETYAFRSCEKDIYENRSSIKSKKNSASRFGGMPDFTLSLSSQFEFGDPNCPIFANTDFLFSGFLPSFNSAGAILGSSKGSSKSVGFYVGVGYGSNNMTKMTTFGIQYNVGSGKNEAITAMVDINGDGLDDVVTRFGNTLYYKAHIVTRTYNQEGEVQVAHSFSPMKPIYGIDNFFRSYERFRSLNGQFTAGWGNFGGFVGKDKSEGDSETDIFFTDGNGDGLMDIVKNGVVYFNKLDANGNPNFVPDSKDTPNMVITAAPRDIELPETNFTLNHPNYDVVKVWEAPAAGKIKITNNIELTDTAQEAKVTVEMKTKCSDVDNDGVCDIDDDCVNVPGPLSNKGCPIVYCYEVSFTVPTVQTQITSNRFYSSVITNMSGTGPYQAFLPSAGVCHRQPSRILNVTLNGITHTPPVSLYYGHGNNAGQEINGCQSQPYTIPYPTSSNPNFSISNLGFEAAALSWFSSFITNLSTYVPGTIDILNDTKMYVHTSGTSMQNKFEYNAYFWTTSGNSGVSRSEYKNYQNALTAPHPAIMPTHSTNLQTGTISQTTGVATNISVNGTNIGSNFNLYTNAGFSQFYTAFFAAYPHSQYPGSTITKSGNVVTIKIKNSQQPFNSIALTAVSSPFTTNTYNFQEVSCNAGRGTESIIVASDKQWSDVKPTIGEIEYGSLRAQAEGNVFDFSVYDKPLNLVIQTTEDNSTYYYTKYADSTEWIDARGSKLLDLKQIHILEKYLPENINQMYDEEKENFKRFEAERIKRIKERAIEKLNVIDEQLDLSVKEEEIHNLTTYSFSSVCEPDTRGICLLYGTQLNASNSIVSNVITNYSTACHAQQGELYVRKGDKVYFRVHSNQAGLNPVVNWNPKVEYIDTNLTTITDVNGTTPYSSSYSDGFILSSPQPVNFPAQSGTAVITWPQFTVTHTDAVTYKIVKRTVTTTGTTEQDVYTFTCNPNAPSTVTAGNINVTVIAPSSQQNMSSTNFSFIVTSSSNTKWHGGEWKPKIVCTTTQPVIGVNNTSEGDLTVSQTFYPVPEYTIYKPYPCGPDYSQFNVSVTNNGNNLTYYANLGGLFAPADVGKKINFIVKRGNRLVKHQSYSINSSGTAVAISSSNIEQSGPFNSNLIEISFTTDDTELRDQQQSILQKIAQASNSVVQIKWNNGSNSYNVPKEYINLFQRANPKFGHMYRNWGQFLYNPVAVQGAVSSPYGNLIKEDALTFSEAYALQIKDAVDAINNLNPAGMSQEDMMTFFNTFEQQYINTLANMPFLIARPDRQYISGEFIDKWIGQHTENYSSATGARAAKMIEASEFEGDRYLEQNVLQTGAYAMSKYSDSNSKNFTGGVSALGGNLGGSKSWDGINNLTSDYIDFNGDLYPDIVGQDHLQYTTTTGGLYNSVGRNGRISITDSENFGLTASGSYSKAGDGESPKSTGSGFQRVEGFRGNSGAGISGNFNQGKSKTRSMYIDINGDGLADYLERNDANNTMSVHLNNGTPTPLPVGSWPAVHLFDSRAKGFSGGIGISLWNGSVEGGVSLTSNKNSTHNTIVDINGDGLMDFVNTEDHIQVQLNTGNKLLNMPVWTSDFNLKNESETTTVSENLGVTFALVWTIFAFTFKIPAVSGNGSLSQSTSRTKKSMSDFDGDGYPDLIEEISTNRLRVHSSRIGRTDMLKKVTNPLGGNFTVDYKVVTPTYENPSPKWVMTDVVVNDGFDLDGDGIDTYRKKYEYEKPRYDRREREFYGFETVKSIDYNINQEGEPQNVYRTTVTKYHNKSYFLQGLRQQQYIYKGTDETKLFTKSINVYKLLPLTSLGLIHTQGGWLPDNFDVGGREGRKAAAVVLSKTEDYVFELTQNPLRTEKIFTYDKYGRVVEYLDKGAEGVDDDYKSVIAYHDDTSLTDANIINVPKRISVFKNQNQQLLRMRSTEIDGTTGAILKVTVLLNDEQSSTTVMAYNEYGNLKQVILPPNNAGEEMTYDYAYDTLENKYVEQIMDSYGYSSFNYYDPKHDKIVQSIDMAGNSTEYYYDSLGRLETIKGPNEQVNNLPYTINFSYYPRFTDIPQEQACIDQNAFMPYAVTKHYDAQHPGNDIETITFTDGLARPMQVKKDIQINEGDLLNPTDAEKMSFSGISSYDEFGRVTVSHQPGVETKDCPINNVVSLYQTLYAGRNSYDEIDRVILSQDAMDNATYIQYAISEDFYNKRALMTYTETDQGGQPIMNKSFKDITGKVTSTLNILNGPGGLENIWTRYTYNPIGELLSYTDANEGQPITTTYKYDFAGRKVELNHADNGKTKYHYDQLGNILKIQTASLAADQSLQPDDRFIKYFYEYTRLKDIIYPDMPSGPNIANVRFIYGDAGNETGRIIFQQDATGYQEFNYGMMGEVIHNKRTIIGPNIPTREFTTRYQYDSWNRLNMLTYPDGEEVTYRYDFGGNLHSMTGMIGRELTEYQYVRRIDYDHFEQRTGILYGNNTTTYYQYTPELRRLQNLSASTATNEKFLDNIYEYDLVGNVKRINNIAPANSINYMGGEYDLGYTYDNLNRLASASGRYRGHDIQQKFNNDFNADFSLDLRYNNTHGIINKNQVHQKIGQPVVANTYENEYRYIAGTHKIERITNSTTNETEFHEYDRNGNLKIRDIDGRRTNYLWDESNRLRVVNKVEQGMHHYIYDAAGERVLKSRSAMEAVYENGSLINSNVAFETYKTYPSAFIVIDHDRYSKHYYAGSQRVVSRIGEVEIDRFNNLHARDKEDNTKTEMPDPEAMRQTQIADLAHMLKKAKAGMPTFRKYVAEKPEVNEEEADDTQSAGKSETKRAEEPPQQFPFRDIYFYHPDHLGTSTFLTDANGQPYQFFLNLPFGETMAEQHSLTEAYESPFKFNGKELDDETGLYYYGARYYDPRTSIWLSTDPLMEKYSGHNPYVYCMQNPINLVDPTGMSSEPPVDGLFYFSDDTGQYWWDYEKGQYEHYKIVDGSTIFSGYYSASEFKEPVGQYNIIFNSNATPKDEFNPDYTPAALVNALHKMLNTFGDIKEISDPQKYPGVRIFSSPNMNGAITLGNVIFTNPNMEYANVLDHEYGHYLDYKHHFNYNINAYFKEVGMPSIYSAANATIRPKKHDHDSSIPEKRANRLGGAWFNNQTLKDALRPK